MMDKSHQPHAVTQEWFEEYIQSQLAQDIKSTVERLIKEVAPEHPRNRHGIIRAPLVQREGPSPLDEAHSDMIKARALMDNQIPPKATKSNRVIIFVDAPESSGNRYIVDMITQAAGCAGKSGHTQPLDHKGRAKNKDWSVLDKRALNSLQNTKCAVIHRSFPHNNAFVDLKKMAQIARGKGFEPRVITLVRFMPAVIKSQIKNKHVPNEGKARENIKRGYLEIFDDVIGGDLPFTIVVYEFLEDPQYVDWLFGELGLDYNRDKIPPFVESNNKHLIKDTSSGRNNGKSGRSSKRYKS